jgi:hypothetical protein
MNPIRFAHATCLIIAAVATMYATASFLTGFDGDFTVSAIVAFVALGAVFAIEHIECERIAQEREAVWRRRIDELSPWEVD